MKIADADVFLSERTFIFILIISQSVNLNQYMVLCPCLHQ